MKSKLQYWRCYANNNDYINKNNQSHYLSDNGRSYVLDKRLQKFYLLKILKTLLRTSCSSNMEDSTNNTKKENQTLNIINNDFLNNFKNNKNTLETEIFLNHPEIYSLVFAIYSQVNKPEFCQKFNL